MNSGVCHRTQPMLDTLALPLCTSGSYERSRNNTVKRLVDISLEHAWNIAVLSAYAAVGNDEYLAAIGPIFIGSSRVQIPSGTFLPGLTNTNGSQLKRLNENDIVCLDSDDRLLSVICCPFLIDKLADVGAKLYICNTGLSAKRRSTVKSHVDDDDDDDDDDEEDDEDDEDEDDDDEEEEKELEDIQKKVLEAGGKVLYDDPAGARHIATVNNIHYGGPQGGPCYEIKWLVGGDEKERLVQEKYLTAMDANDWHNLGIDPGHKNLPHITKKACYELAIELDPCRSESWYNLGSAGGNEHYSAEECRDRAEQFTPPPMATLLATVEREEEAEAQKRAHLEYIAGKDWDRDFGGAFPDLMVGLAEGLAEMKRNEEEED